jgi:hypothetical protein
MPKDETQRIKNFLQYYVVHNAVEDYRLPDELRSPRNPEEFKRRLDYLQMGLAGSVLPLLSEILGRHLLSDESAFVTRWIAEYLETNG